MVKDHNVRMRITNNSTLSMTYVGDWYDSGRLADMYSWPQTISENGGHCDILSYEKDNSWAGCSGYVQYKMGKSVVTIAFSNPASGSNKLGCGTDGKRAWDNMHSHDYNPFTFQISIDTGSGTKQLDFKQHCTGGTTNDAAVKITNAS